MALLFQPMTREHAQAIAAWHYDGVYAFYDLDQDPEDREEFLDPASWDDVYFAVMDEDGALVGFFSFNRSGDAVVLGLGLRPDLTGQGRGMEFLEAGIQFARERYRPQVLRLSVATFNQRAIRLYERAGFTRVKTFMNRTNGGEYEFLEMTRPA